MLATSPSPRSFPAKSPTCSTRLYRISPNSSTLATSSITPQQASTSRKRDSSVAELQSSTVPASPLQPSKAGRRDVGTQYSPPDWPPTSSRSSLRQTLNPSTITIPQPASIPPPPPPLAAPSHSSGTQQRQAEPQVSKQNLAVAPASTHGSQDAAPSSPQPPIAAAPSDTGLRVPVSPTLQHAIRRPLSADSNAASSASGSTNVTDSNTTSRSASKRPRHNDSSASSHPLTLLPDDYSLCPPKTLATIIASMLMRLIAHNDSIPIRDGHLTRFHSRAPPGISVHDYLARLTFHATLSPPILLSMVFFIDRLSSYFPKFIINSLTVHRFLITAATVASKGLSDSFWTNPVYARVGGVSVKELALLELELLTQCQWKIVPKPQDLVEYYRGLVRQSEGFILEDDASEHDINKAKAAAAASSSNSGVEMAALSSALPSDDVPHKVKAPAPEEEGDATLQSNDDDATT